MGRNLNQRRSNAAPRAAESLEAQLHKEWASTTPTAFCEQHVGEAHSNPRCPECDQAEVIAAAAQVQARLVRYIPGTECERHGGYPIPCHACARDVLKSSRQD
jgi:hypothetical protein